MSTKGNAYEPTILERVLFGVFGALHTFIGVYAVGPWYLNTSSPARPTLAGLFENHNAIRFYGVAILIAGIALLYTAFAHSETKWYYSILTNALLFGFLIRLYSLIGTMLIQQSWRPPTYVSPLATVLVVGVLFVWTRLRERFAK